MPEVVCADCGEVRKIQRIRYDDRRNDRCILCANRARKTPWTWERIEHGTPRGYNQHRYAEIPMSDDCGCSAARSALQAKQKTARTIRHARCAGCNERTDIREDRGDLCAPCWRAAEKAKESRTDLWSGPGRWVTRNNIQVWQEDASA